MSSEDRLSPTRNALAGRFPEGEELGIDKSNPAIRLYGRRFYQDQTPVEYLAELLLVFASPKRKGADKKGAFSFKLDQVDGAPKYWPEDRIALKLFAFFPSSTLETRHPVHRQAYLDALSEVKARIRGSEEEKDQTVRLLQSLFSGFVGVAKNRTWVTQSFLPASTYLLGRELVWLHSEAAKDVELNSWDDAREYFDISRYLFMARGGELLFLQLANLFSRAADENAIFLCSQLGYEHLAGCGLLGIQERIETGLRAILSASVTPLDKLARFVEDGLADYRVVESPKQAPLGWVPATTIPEALLFAHELENICRSDLGSLEKIDLLQLLCCMQVLRSLCFQARRAIAPIPDGDGFVGGYAWIAADPCAGAGSAVRKLAQNSFERIEEMLYGVLRRVAEVCGAPKSFNEADKHGFGIFRRIAKQIGLVVPLKGRGQRFVLPPSILRFLVAVLVAPGERIRLTEFYRRAFAHYGIALGAQQLAVALHWTGGESGPRDYAVSADTTWVEEALQQGGFLVELSDAVSIVRNPGGSAHGA